MTTPPFTPPTFFNEQPPYLDAYFFNDIGPAVKRVIDALNALDTAFNERAQDASAAMLVGTSGAHEGIIFEYLDDDNRVKATVSPALGLQEAGAGLRLTPELSPDNLLSKINDYRGFVTQPLPAAMPGRMIGFRQRTIGLILQAATDDKFVNSTGEELSILTLPTVGELIFLRCSYAGKWRIYGGHKSQRHLDNRVNRQVLKAITDRAFPPVEAGTVHPNPPTVTHGTSQPLSAPISDYGYIDNRITNLSFAELPGAGLAANDPIGSTSRNTGAWGIETYVTGTDLVIYWRASPDASAQMHIFVDDQQITNGPFVPSGISIVLGGSYYTRIQFPGYGYHKVTIYWQGVAPYSYHTPMTTMLTPPDRKRPKLAVVGASYSSNTSYYSLLQAWCWPFSRMMGMEILQAAAGGSGYVTPGLYGNFNAQARLDVIEKWKPDIMLVEGSGNDDGVGGVQAAATAFFAYWMNKFPDMPIVVCGAMPRSADGSMSNIRGANIDAVRQAAAVSPNVVGFIDPVGYPATGSLPAYSAGGVYAIGDRVVWRGAVWRAKVIVNGAPAAFQYVNWELLSWTIGTGYTGATTNDGPRDVLVAADAVHPTPFGQLNFAGHMAREFRKIIMSP